MVDWNFKARQIERDYKLIETTLLKETSSHRYNIIIKGTHRNILHFTNWTYRKYGTAYVVVITSVPLCGDKNDVAK